MVEIYDFPDGWLEIRWKGRSLPYSAFDKLQRVNHAAIVENKRLGEILHFNFAQIVTSQLCRNTGDAHVGC